MRGLLLAAGVVFGAASSAHAANPPVWTVDPGQSSISFEYIEGGNLKTGAFDMFMASIAFDPKKPEQASASFSVDTASISLNDALREGVLVTVPWFNSDKYPRANFSLVGLRPTDGGKYLADGVLRIKGIEMPVELNVSLSLDGKIARAMGALEIDRTEFRLRDVLLESIVEIGARVSISFDLVATLDLNE